MILVDAIYINDSGGKVLLDYLISELEKSEKKIHYLLDKRILGNIPSIKDSNTVTFEKNSYTKRLKFYKKNRNFTSVLCFGNIPPPIKLDAKVFTYFHQKLFLDIPNNFSLQRKIVFSIKSKVVKSLKNNTDFWIVQTSDMKKKLSQKYIIPKDIVINLPFFSEMNESGKQKEKEKNSFIYISNAEPQKNVEILLRVFPKIMEEHQNIKLYLTIPKQYEKVVSKISGLQEQYPIINLGYLNRKEVEEKLLTSEFLVYPSLSESFGLGIIEAISCDCKVIGADLEYMHDVCIPSFVFNPYDDTSLENAIKNVLSQKLKPTIPRMKNNIVHLIDLLV